MEIILLDKINANAIIFLLFIFLLIYPLISNFKVGDISGNCYDIFEFDKAKEKMDTAIGKLASKDILQSKKDQEELNKKIKNVENIIKGENNNNSQYILEAARKGTELLGKNLDYETLTIWQRYVQSIMSLISKTSNTNYLNLYMQFNMSILMFSLYEQVKRTVEFLIDIAKYI